MLLIVVNIISWAILDTKISIKGVKLLLLLTYKLAESKDSSIIVKQILNEKSEQLSIEDKREHNNIINNNETNIDCTCSKEKENKALIKKRKILLEIEKIYDDLMFQDDNISIKNKLSIFKKITEELNKVNPESGKITNKICNGYQTIIEHLAVQFNSQEAKHASSKALITSKLYIDIFY